MKIFDLLKEDDSNSSADAYYEIIKVEGKKNNPDDDVYYLNIGNLDKKQKISLLKNKFVPNKNIRDMVYFYRTKRQMEYFLKNELASLVNNVNKIIPNLLPPPNQLADQLINAEQNKPTSQQIAKANESLANLMDRIISSYEKPEVRTLLSNIGTIGIDDEITDNVFGHVYSPKNILLAYAQDPSVTFLATRRRWKELNRMVDNSAKPIILKGTGNVDYSPESAEISLGIKKSTAQKISKQSAHKFDVESSVDPRFFQYYIYYDISDTKVIAGKKDIWAEQPGLKNNLTKELNQLAIDLLNKRKSEINIKPSKSPIIDSDAGKNNFIMNNIVSNKQLINLLGDNVVNSFKKRDFNDDKTVFDALYQIYSNIFERTHDKQLKETQIYTSMNFTFIIEDFGGKYSNDVMIKTRQLLNKEKPTKEDVIKVFNNVLKVRQMISSTNEGIDMNLNESNKAPELEALLNKIGFSLSDFPSENSDIDGINETIKIILKNKNML